MAGLSSFGATGLSRSWCLSWAALLDVALAAVLPVARSATSFASRNSRSRAMFFADVYGGLLEKYLGSLDALVSPSKNKAWLEGVVGGFPHSGWLLGE